MRNLPEAETEGPPEVVQAVVPRIAPDEELDARCAVLESNISGWGYEIHDVEHRLAPSPRTVFTNLGNSPTGSSPQFQ